VGNGDAITVWHPCLAAVLRVTDPLIHVEIEPTLIDAFDNVAHLKQSASISTMMPVHALSRVHGQRLGQTPVEAEDVLPICGQATVLVYTKEADKALGTMIFGELNAVDTRREVTVERYFKAQLDARFHDNVCCYATGSDRLLYLFVTIVVGTTLYKTRSGAHITALSSIVDQAIDDLERQTGVKLRV
jgi:porphobilinogen deaminase